MRPRALHRLVLVAVASALLSGCDEPGAAGGGGGAPVGAHAAAVDGAAVADATADGEEPLGPDQCRSDSDCAGAMCLYPGAFPDCGACVTPEATCADDAECAARGAGLVCAVEPCACAGERVCLPGCGGDDSRCGSGERCAAGGRCAPAPCATDADCPADLACFLAAPEAVCERRACATDAVCDGWCVAGSCRAQPGYCGAPPG